MRSWAVVNIEPGTLNFELLYMVCDEKGMMLERETAGPYGDGKTAGISKHGLSSNMFDADTGLYYFAARWPVRRSICEGGYDPDTGRFLQMDPVITEIGLINMYDYCNNNPLNVTDRYGEVIPVPAIIGVVAVIGALMALDAISETETIRNYSEGKKEGTSGGDAAGPRAEKVPSPHTEEEQQRRRDVENEFREGIRSSFTDAAQDMASLMAAMSGSPQVMDYMMQNKEALLAAGAGGAFYVGISAGGWMTPVGTMAFIAGYGLAGYYSFKWGSRVGGLINEYVAGQMN